MLYNLFYKSYEITFRGFKDGERQEETLGFTIHIPRFFGNLENQINERTTRLKLDSFARGDKRCYLFEKIERYYV